MIYVIAPTLRSERAKHVCNLCGKPSEETLCEICSIKLRGTALLVKKHEDKGEA